VIPVTATRATDPEGVKGLSSTRCCDRKAGQELRRTDGSPPITISPSCPLANTQGALFCPVMRYRILCVGIDLGLLKTRQALLASRGYDSLIATAKDFEEKLRSGKFHLVILSAMLSEEEKHQIQAKLPVGTRPLVLERLVLPEELLRIVAEALG
jgi:hypothetical protein